MPGAGFGFVLKRWWTGSPKQDQATYLHTVADLGAKLRASGMTMEDVRQLEAIMRDPSVSSSSTAKQVVEEIAEEVNEPEAFHSNVAMKGRTGAACEVAEAKLQQALLDLQLLLSEQENEALERLSSTGASIAALWKTAPSSNMKEEHMRRWR